MDNTDIERNSPKCCKVSIESCNNTKRCFMTGEYCSQQLNIHMARRKILSLASNNSGDYVDNRDNASDSDAIEIIAFVIMNFSDMSDVVYKWRLQPYIKSLSKYLYISNGYLYCYEKELKTKDELGDKKRVRISVVRSDTDSANNFVICNRICQQMQIASIVIVDVSSQNPNVFYELGMAVSLGKLILPICYSESYFKRDLPERVNRITGMDNIQRHISFYPWNKTLFEYYGIVFKTAIKTSINEVYAEQSQIECQNDIGYIDFESATGPDSLFSDRKYDCFPYDEKIICENNQTEKVGWLIYNALKQQYNNASYRDNTLVVYTIEGFLNEEQSGLCIINYYESIVRKVIRGRCFCGDRIGVLVQENIIPESDKDSKKQRSLLYNIGEIIQIGVNQSTYIAAEHTIRPREKMEIEIDNFIEEDDNETERRFRGQIDGIERFVKEYTRNRGMIVYPNNPVYVNRFRSHLHDDLIEVLFSKAHGNSNDEDLFCLFHIMLSNLRYVNQIVVDVSNNCLQALFWLGIAHGIDVYAITIKHELSKKEKTLLQETQGKSVRNVFDVAGLWTAIYHSNDTEGFYRQLGMVQMGIERNAKRLLPNYEYETLTVNDFLLKADNDENRIRNKIRERKLIENQVFESYYRSRFWFPMLRYNRLNIFMVLKTDIVNEITEERVDKWDFEAASVLTHYLSKHTVIGEYTVSAVDNKKQKNSQKNKNPNNKRNMLCIGDLENPATSQLIDRIKKMSIGELSNSIHSLSGAIENHELASLILWKEGESIDYLGDYNVAIIGRSGPATLGLAHLFVDESTDDDSNIIKERGFLLNELQISIRNKFKLELIDRINRKLEEVLPTVPQRSQCGDVQKKKQRYKELVKCVVISYLDTVIYKYFLPFISDEEIEQIINGLYQVRLHACAEVRTDR